MNTASKLAQNKPLTFPEEAALQMLWHETVHNRQIPDYAGGDNTESRKMMELVTEWTARRTYEDFIKALGGKATHKLKIRSDGYSYGYMINNFDALCQACGLGMKHRSAILAHFENIIANVSRKKYKKEITDFILNHANIKLAKSEIDRLLSDAVAYDCSIYENILKSKFSST